MDKTLKEIFEHCTVYYPAAILSEQDTNESYWHNLAHLLNSQKFIDWVTMDISWILFKWQRWN